MQTLEIEYRQEVAIVWLNRPEKKNAMSFQMMRELIQAAKTLAKNKKIRAVILSGRGETFCAGIDLADLGNKANRKYAFWQLIKPAQSVFQKAALIWRTLPVPVIAAVQGHCLGAGVQLMLGADMRIGTEESQVAILEARWGIVPDMGLSVSARGVMADDVLREWVYTARTMSGKEAHQYGLFTRLHDEPLQAALDLATEIATRSPDAVLAGKRVIAQMKHKPWRSLWAEKIWQLKLLTGKNQRIAVQKARDKATRYLPRQYK